MKRAPWVVQKQMLKLVRHNQPQAWNFQKQPVATPCLIDTGFQWQACHCAISCCRLPSWLVYEFTSLSLKFSLSEDSFQFQVHNTISKTRVSGMRSLHKALTHPAPAGAHLCEPPHRNTFHRKCSGYCTNSITPLTSHPMGTGPATFYGWYLTASQKGGTSLCQVAGWYSSHPRLTGESLANVQARMTFPTLNRYV